MHSILVVEDDPIIRHTVVYSLRREGFEVAHTGNGNEALAMSKMKPDLVLLDLMLPGLDGFRVAEKLRASDTKVAIIILSALDAEHDRVRGLNVGADDYVSKPFSMEELLARVRANLRRVSSHERPANDVIQVGDLILDAKSHRLSVAGNQVALRRKEFQLLKMLIDNDGGLCTRQMLAAEVWGQSHMPTSRAIDTHIRRIRVAIASPSFSYIHTVHGLGYRFEARPTKDSDEAPRGQ